MSVMKGVAAAALLLSAGGLRGTEVRAAEVARRVLVELFTSQG